MKLYLAIYGIVFAYFFLLNNEGKIDISMFIGVKHSNIKVATIEVFSRVSFLLLLTLVVISFTMEKNIIDANIFAIIMQLLALIIFIVSKKSMASNWATNITNSQNNLTTNGVFKFSRNPVYVSYHILFLSMLFYSLSLFLGLYILFTITFHLLILEEEKYLKSRFGSEYMDYCNDTRRYI